MSLFHKFDGALPRWPFLSRLVRYPSWIHEREECRLNFKILSNMSHVFGTSSNRIAISVLVTCSGLWAGCGTTLVPQSDRDSESQAVFHQLAGLEVASNRLYESIADQSDVEGFSHQLAVESDRASPFTSLERARIAQSFVRSLKVMLFDLAPANFWGTSSRAVLCVDVVNHRGPAIG